MSDSDFRPGSRPADGQERGAARRGGPGDASGPTTSKLGAVLAELVALGPAAERRRAPGVEANARLTAATGLLLLVMLAAEGVTIASIRPLLTWHVAIGLALLPPVALKVGSTMWRFGRYYLGDPRYGEAGPPHLILRVLGPVVVLTTIAVLASGVAVWQAGPQHGRLITVHIASFIVWFAFMAIHVLVHTMRAGRLTAADLRPHRPHSSAVPLARLRQGLVLASLLAGMIVAVTTRGLASGWVSWAHHVR